jgi:histidinol-phosphate aminotransferase
MDVGKIVKPNVRSLRAYQAKEIPCRIKLDANESPYGLKILKTVKTNRYPDPEATALRRLAARDIRVKTENILHGNGSDELISYLVATFGGPVLYPVPTFSMYGIISQVFGERRIEVPLDREFDLDMQKTLTMIKRYRPRLIFLSSPNNPTGNSFSSERMLKLIKSAPSLVVVDEAYQLFSGRESFVPLIKNQNNLVVLRTLSKIGLAGLRIGFMIADPAVVHEVNKVRLPFNLNALSQKVAVDALKDRKSMRSFTRSVISDRKRLLEQMRRIDGVDPYPSDANFILFKVHRPEKMYRGLLKKGVLVRNMKGIVNSCLRVTVGTPKENTAFLRTLKDLIQGT